MHIPTTFCTAKLTEYLPQNFTEKHIQNALYLKKQHGDTFVFDYGVLITCGSNAATKQQLKLSLIKSIRGEVIEPKLEEFAYYFAEEETMEIEKDVFYVGKITWFCYWSTVMGLPRLQNL